MNIINIQAAKTHLSRIVENVVAGKEIVLAKAGKPLVKLIPFVSRNAPRKGGQWAGKIFESANCWQPETEDFPGLANCLEPASVHKHPPRKPARLHATEKIPAKSDKTRARLKPSRK